MSIFLRYELILILLCFQVPAKCGGYASWWQETRYGSEICKEKGSNGYAIGIECRDHKRNGVPQNMAFHENGHLITNISRWYFYKNHIVGEITEEGQTRFFIFNEATCQSQLYQVQEEFDVRIREMRLKPILWTRWYEKNWGFFITDGHILDKLTFAYVKVPALIVFGIVMLIGLVRTNFRLGHVFNKATLIILVLIIMRFILDIFPGSI